MPLLPWLRLGNRSAKPPRVTPLDITIMLVRTGEYKVFYDAVLTDAGMAQAHEVATTVAERLKGRPVAVLLPDERTLGLRACYGQTATVIADALEVPVCSGSLYERVQPLLRIGAVTLDSFHRMVLRDIQRAVDKSLRMREIPVIVMVIDGSALNHLLDGYGPPRSEGDMLGPPYGSVHELQLVLNLRDGAIIDRKFV